MSMDGAISSWQCYPYLKDEDTAASKGKMIWYLDHTFNLSK